MKKLLFIALLVTAVSLNAAESTNEHPMKLKDGSFLFMNEDETMRMVDKEGRPIKMKDSVEMELEDGTMIMMKNKKMWRHEHQKMKGRM